MSMTFLHLRPHVKSILAKAEENHQLSFLNILVIRIKDGILRHAVYNKGTHTHIYLHADFHNLSPQIKSFVNSLFHKDKALADSEYIDAGLRNVKVTL